MKSKHSATVDLPSIDSSTERRRSSSSSHSAPNKKVNGRRKKSKGSSSGSDSSDKRHSSGSYRHSSAEEVSSRTGDTRVLSAGASAPPVLVTFYEDGGADNTASIVTGRSSAAGSVQTARLAKRITSNGDDVGSGAKADYNDLVDESGGSLRRSSMPVYSKPIQNEGMDFRSSDLVWQPDEQDAALPDVAIARAQRPGSTPTARQGQIVSVRRDGNESGRYVESMLPYRSVDLRTVSKLTSVSDDDESVVWSDVLMSLARDRRAHNLLIESAHLSMHQAYMRAQLSSGHPLRGYLRALVSHEITADGNRPLDSYFSASSVAASVLAEYLSIVLLASRKLQSMSDVFHAVARIPLETSASGASSGPSRPSSPASNSSGSAGVDCAVSEPPAQQYEYDPLSSPSLPLLAESGPRLRVRSFAHLDEQRCVQVLDLCSQFVSALSKIRFPREAWDVLNYVVRSIDERFLDEGRGVAVSFLLGYVFVPLILRPSRFGVDLYGERMKILIFVARVLDVAVNTPGLMCRDPMLAFADSFAKSNPVERLAEMLTRSDFTVRESAPSRVVLSTYSSDVLKVASFFADHPLLMTADVQRYEYLQQQIDRISPWMRVQSPRSYSVFESMTPSMLALLTADELFDVLSHQDGLLPVAVALRFKSVEGSQLLDLDDAELQVLGVTKLGLRKRLLRALSTIQNNQESFD